MLHELPTINLKLNGKNYKLYVAHSPEVKRSGLSGIKDLEPDAGMIFPYDDDRPRTFQFRETLVPLMIYFVDSSGKVVQRSSAAAGQQSTITCKTPCRWVIEILDKDRYYVG